MAEFLNDLQIHGAGQIQFKTTAGANAGKIDQDGNNLVLSNSVGDILLGDGSADVYIGDGNNNVDILFEQSGNIKADDSANNVTLTLGSSNTTLNLVSPNITGSLTLPATTINSKLTFGTTNGFILFDYEPSGDTGEYATEVPLIKVDRSGEESTILARISEYRGIALGIDDTTWIRAGDTSSVVRSNVNLAEEVVLMSAESGFRAIGFPGNDTTWSNRNEFLFYSQSTTAANNGLYIGDGGSTQFIDLSRNLKNIGSITASGQITSGRLNITDAGVPIMFTESGNTGTGKYWRQVLDAGDIRFDVDTTSTNGDGTFSSYNALIQLNADGHTDINGNLDVGGGIDVTGNITVSGTVDGRDVSADGGKLDGIESGATADQSATEILTAIKTVDGAGSGLDADTLDGSHASAFLAQGSFSAGYTGDMNDLTGLRVIRSTSGSNRAFAAHHNVLTLPNTSASQYGAQIAFETGSISDGGIKFRNSTNGTFTSWYRLYHEGHKPTLAELGAQASGNYITGTGSLSAQDLTDIGNLSGTNTGDQDLSGYLLNTTDTFTGVLTLEHNTSAGLIVKNSGNSGQDASIVIRGSRNAPSAGVNPAKLVLQSYDSDQGSGTNVTGGEFYMEATSETGANLTDFEVGIRYRKDGSVIDGFKIHDGTFTVNGSVTTSGITLDGNTITGVDDSGEFTDDDAHIMTSAGVNDRISTRISGLTSNTGTVTGTGADTRLAVWDSSSGLTSDSTLLWRDDNSTPANKELYLGGRIIPTLGVKLDDGASHSPSVSMTGYDGSGTSTAIWQMYARSTGQLVLQEGSDIVFELTTAGNLTLDGTISASNFSGSSSGTNTGDQDLSSYYNSEADVTQHEGALSIGYNQLTGTVPTWNQDTTGNAATATTASQATNLNATDDRDMAPEDLSYSDDLRIFFSAKEGLEDGSSTGSDWHDVLLLNSYSDSSGGNANILAFDKNSYKIRHYQAGLSATNWGTAKEIAYTDHTHATSDITSGTFADARIAESNVTQHQSALSITESQISDLGNYITGLNFNALSNKGSGTGNYSTSGYLEAGRGSGGVALTHNDGYGNANVTFNHVSGTPEQAGSSGRIVVTTDSTTAKMTFELKDNVSNGTAVNTPSAMELNTSGAYIPGVLNLGDTADTTLSRHSAGNVSIESNRVFHDGYHPNADEWTTARTITFTGGDVTGSVTLSGGSDQNCALTVTDGSHNHAAGDITSGTFDVDRIPNLNASKITAGTFVNARVAESNVTQHQAALSINYNQLTGTVPTWNQDTTGSAAGVSTDGSAKFYTWRALNNTSDANSEYYRIARITATQSTRFIIELAGRSTSYSDGVLPAFGKIVGQLNNDNNYDIVYYNASATDEVVDEVGQVDVSTTATDIYVRVTTFSELTAIAHISDGTITTYGGDSPSVSAPSGYAQVTEYKLWNQGNDGSGSGLDADLLDGQEGSYYLNYNNFTNTPTIPTNNNQLTNGAGYITEFDITTQTDSKYIRSNANDNVTGHTEWQDSYYAAFGNNADMRIYHNGTNSFIDNRQGSLYIRANVGSDTNGDLHLRPKESENGIIIRDDAEVEIYHNNALKMETHSGGISVVGSIDANSNIGNLNTNDDVGQQLEYGNADVATLRFDADRWRVYSGGAGGVGERFTVLETGNVGINDSTPSYKLDVFGTIRATGDVIAFSDERVKENIKTIDNSLEKVNKLRGVEFNKIGEDKKSIGVIAQEVEKILPEVVKTDDEGMKSVAYGNVVGVLIEAIKELNKEVEKLKTKLNNGN